MRRDNLWSKLERMRPPRVQIDYDVEIGDAISQKELPFVVGVLSDLAGSPQEPRQPLTIRNFIDIDLDNFNLIMKKIDPMIRFEVRNLITNSGDKLQVKLRFSDMDDFEAARVIGQIKPLKDLFEQRQKLKNSKPDKSENGIKIHEIDDLLSRQLNEIIHAPEFKKLEASWRGLHYLVTRTETSEMIKIRVLSVAKNDLLKNFDRTPEFDQTFLFKKIYEEVYGTFGSDPFCALIGDFEFGLSPRDIHLLEKISQVAAAAHCPFIAAASPALFSLNSFTELGTPRDLDKMFHTVEYTIWKSFRSSEDSRYIGLTLPHILLRAPYSPRPAIEPVFQFTELVDEHGLFLWGNAAYAFGVCLTNAFAKYHWCAKIRGTEGGGLVEGLPVHTFETDEGDPALKCPTEIAITDRREKELADLGFIPLVHCKNSEYAAFFSASSCHQPRTYDSDMANANARLSSQLQCLMTTSRFAQYLKVITRDKIGSFVTRNNIEQFLNIWIAKYVNLDDDASPLAKARYPLREARIDVSEAAGKPGIYVAVLFIRPYFQLDELSVSLRLVIELPFAVGQ